MIACTNTVPLLRSSDDAEPTPEGTSVRDTIGTESMIVVLRLLLPSKSKPRLKPEAKPVEGSIYGSTLVMSCIFTLIFTSPCKVGVTEESSIKPTELSLPSTKSISGSVILDRVTVKTL